MKFSYSGTSSISMHVVVDENFGQKLDKSNSQISDSTTPVGKNACSPRPQLTSVTSATFPKERSVFHIGNQCAKITPEPIAINGVQYEKYTSFILIGDSSAYCYRELSCLVKPLAVEHENVIASKMTDFDPNSDLSDEVRLIVSEGRSNISIETGEVFTLSLEIKEPLSDIFEGSLTKCYGATEVNGQAKIVPLLGFTKEPGCTEADFVWHAKNTQNLLHSISFKGKFSSL